MQPKTSFDVMPSVSAQTQPQPSPLAQAPTSLDLAFNATAPQPVEATPSRRTLWIILGVAVGVITIIIGVFLFANRSIQTASLNAGDFSKVDLSLSDLSTAGISLGDTATTLKVNGQLQVSNSLLLTPGSQPVNPVAGQIYYDQQANEVAYFNGQEFISFGGTNDTAAPAVTAPTGVNLQSTAPGTQQTGSFNITGTGQVGKLKTSVIDSGGDALYINPIGAVAQQTITPGTPATVGLTTPGSGTTGTGWNNDISATKITMGSVGGTAVSISVHYGGGSASSHVQVGLYDDTGDIPSQPGSLLAASNVANLVPNGFTTITIPSVSLSPNATYWLAVNTDDPNVVRTFNGGSKSTCFTSSGFGFMRDPITPPGCFFDDNNYAIYLNYLSGGNTNGSFSQASLVLGATGQALFQNAADSNNAFQIQNASGTTAIFNVDTINGRIGIGKTSPTYKLDIAAGDVNLSNGRSLRFGGSPALSVNASGTTTTITNFLSGGSISAQAASFYVQDADAAHRNLAIDSDGASIFSNRIDSTAGFQIQAANGTLLLRADTTNLRLYVGDPAGSATPVVLFLANKNTSGDPVTGAEGGTYYNSTLASFRCYRNGSWQNCADIEPQHSFSLYDEFIGGQTSFTGQIGSLGWSAAAIGANGSLALNPSTPTPSANRPGVLRIQTPAVTNQGTTLLLGDNSSPSMLIAKDNSVKTSVATGAATGQVLRVGLHTESTTTTQPVSGVWWEANPAVDVNWRYCYGNGTTATCTNTSVAIAANTWVTLETRVTATGAGTSAATFVIDNTPFTVSAVTIDTTNRVSPALSCYSTSGAAQNCFWDYFHLTGTTSTTR